MKRLVLVCRPAAGGMRTHIISLLSLLDRARWQVYLAAPQTLLESLPDDLPRYHSLPTEINASTSPIDFVVALRLAKDIRGLYKEAGEWPLVHAHGLRAAWVAVVAQAITRFPLLITLHNLPSRGWLAKNIVGFITTRARRVVCVSKSVADAVPGKNKKVIPNGIDLAQFILVDRLGARRELGLEPDEFMVAAAARLSQEKGIDLLLQAAAKAPDMTFLIAGDGPERSQLESILPKNARLLGRIRKVEQLFAACDIAVVPSRSEGQGIAALEAMAAGAPLIASQVGGLGEMVKDGETGLLVPPEDSGAILLALRRLRDDSSLREQLAESGREYALRHADVNDMIATLEEIYEAAARRLG